MKNAIEQLIEKNNKLIKTNKKAIRDNNKLIKEQKEIVAKLDSKLAIGNVIHALGCYYVICSNYFVESVAGEFHVRVLVHPNLRIRGNDIDDIEFGCAYDLLIFPLDYIDKIEVTSIFDLIVSKSEQFLNAQKTHVIIK